MAKAQALVWDGMAELIAEVKQLPEACTGEAAKIAEGVVNGVTLDIKAAYPWRTGNLRTKTTVSPLKVRGKFITGGVVKNTSPLAIIFENGTQARHYVTVNGVKHLTGRMPPGHVFWPRIAKARRALTQLLKDMVLRRGAVSVTGE